MLLSIAVIGALIKSLSRYLAQNDAMSPGDFKTDIIDVSYRETDSHGRQDYVKEH